MGGSISPRAPPPPGVTSERVGPVGSRALGAGGPALLGALSAPAGPPASEEVGLSQSIDLFVATDDPIIELAALLGREAGLEAGPVGPDGSVTLSSGALAATLYEHDLPDGDVLHLGAYRYVLSATVTLAGHPGGAPETLLLRRLAATLAGRLRVLLVVDARLGGPHPHEPAPDGPGPAPRVARSWER